MLRPLKTSTLQMAAFLSDLDTDLTIEATSYAGL